MDIVQLASYIDHTLLKPEATTAQVTQLCEEAITHQFIAVCVNPTHVAHACQQLADSAVKVCTVIGFPLGATTSENKFNESLRAIDLGATELDMVVNIGALKDSNDVLVESDIAGVADIAHRHNALCKVIIETALLTDEEKARACQLAQKAGADFVKTSTGFSSGGATVEDVALMRQTVGPKMGVKASGGIRTLADAQQMIQAGANRLGASAGVKIIEEAKAI